MAYGCSRAQKVARCFGAEYLTVCAGKPKSYSDYENYKIKFGDTDDYELAAKIGQGKFSEVFSGYNVLTKQRVAMKILRDYKIEKINREVLILETLKDIKGVNHIIEVCKEKGTQKVMLVSSFVEGPMMFQIHTQLHEKQIQKYIYQILKVVDKAHSRGIMHRDLKPSNIIINRKTEQLTILDWGLGEFYLPNKEYFVKVATRPYKPPELLVGHRKYDYRLDTWSIGCILAAMVYHAYSALQKRLHVPGS